MTSLLGLTRQSIILSKDLFPMDARVKRAHDDLDNWYTQTKRPRQNRGLRSRHTPPIKSARIEFNDQMRLHLDRRGYVRQSWDAGELCRHLGVIDFEEIGHVALGKLNGFQNGSELF